MSSKTIPIHFVCKGKPAGKAFTRQSRPSDSAGSYLPERECRASLRACVQAWRLRAC